MYLLGSMKRPSALSSACLRSCAGVPIRQKVTALAMPRAGRPESRPRAQRGRAAAADGIGVGPHSGAARCEGWSSVKKTRFTSLRSILGRNIAPRVELTRSQLLSATVAPAAFSLAGTHRDQPRGGLFGPFAEPLANSRSWRTPSVRCRPGKACLDGAPSSRVWLSLCESFGCGHVFGLT